LKVLINVAKPALLPALSAELPVRLSEDDGGKNIKNETVTPSQSAENQIASNQHKPSSSAVKSKSNLSSESSSGTNTAAEPSSKAITDGRRELKSQVPSSNSLPVEPKNARSEVANKLQVQTTGVCDQSSSSKSSEVNTDKSGLVIRKRKKAKVTKQEVIFPIFIFFISWILPFFFIRPLKARLNMMLRIQRNSRCGCLQMIKVEMGRIH